jgi:Ku70/Ku80 beta-barrel domain
MSGAPSDQHDQSQDQLSHQDDYGRCPKPTKSCSGVISFKGYEFQKERYLLLSEQDFDSVKVESSSVMNIGKFIEVDSIDPIYYPSSYYLAPDGEAGRDVYAVLHQAIEETGRVALARVVIGQARTDDRCALNVGRPRCPYARRAARHQRCPVDRSGGQIGPQVSVGRRQIVLRNQDAINQCH